MKNKIELYKDYLINWLRDWFNANGADCQAVIGVSGGKDSTTIAALCCEALDPWRVIGVLMPNGNQKDIEDSYAVVKHLGIRHVEINIEDAYNGILNQFAGNNMIESEQTKVNLPPRLRMATLYAVAQSMNGRVVGTSNLDEYMLGWQTRFGDSVSDVEPIIKLHANEVVELGLALGVPEYLMRKEPTDGLGEVVKSDADKMGFTYQEFQDFYERHHGQMDLRYEGEMLTDKEEKMWQMYRKSEFKRRPIPEPPYYPGYFDEPSESFDAAECNTDDNEDRTKEESHDR